MLSSSGTDLVTALANLDYPHEIENLYFGFDAVREADTEEMVLLLEERGEDFRRKLSEQVLETIADYLTELSLEVGSPENMVIDPTRYSSGAYDIFYDSVSFRGYYQFADLSTPFHELLHKYQLREWIGRFDSEGGRKETVEKFFELTSEILRDYLDENLHLKNNNFLRNYIFLMALDRSPDLADRLREAKEAYEDYSKEGATDKADKIQEVFMQVVRAEGFDDHPLYPPMEAFASVASMYFEDELEDHDRRDFWVQAGSRICNDEMIIEWLRKLYKLYDSAKGGPEEKFKKVMRAQKGLFGGEKGINDLEDCDL